MARSRRHSRKHGRKHSRKHRRYLGGNGSGSDTLGDVGGSQGYVLGQVGTGDVQYRNTETNNLPIGNALVGLNGQSVAKIMSGGRHNKRHMMSSLAGGKRRRSRRHRRSRYHRGGMPYGSVLSPSSFDGMGVGTSGVGLQFVAGNAN
jgi:hypothetical protein